MTTTTALLLIILFLLLPVGLVSRIGRRVFRVLLVVGLGVVCVHLIAVASIFGYSFFKVDTTTKKSHLSVALSPDHN